MRLSIAGVSAASSVQDVRRLELRHRCAGARRRGSQGSAVSGRSYTPVFSSIYTGTLYGRWPAAAVWATLLPLFDRHGILDVSIDALCVMTGWPRDLLELGIKQLMETDPSSRSPAEGGRRLVLLEEGRSWGWKAVNHSHYREQARLLAKDSARTASGLDAERKRKARENRKLAEGGVPRCPPVSPSQTETETETETKAGKRLAKGKKVSTEGASLSRTIEAAPAEIDP